MFHLSGTSSLLTYLWKNTLHMKQRIGSKTCILDRQTEKIKLKRKRKTKPVFQQHYSLTKPTHDRLEPYNYPETDDFSNYSFVHTLQPHKQQDWFKGVMTEKEVFLFMWSNYSISIKRLAYLILIVLIIKLQQYETKFHYHHIANCLINYSVLCCLEFGFNV